VDEILALEEGKLKFAKRKLRVQRCKTIPGSSLSTKHLTADNHKSSTAKAQSHLKSKESQQPKPNQKATKQGHSAQPPKPIIVPKGDPKLGDKLAHLSKEDRKRAKSADADRVARRLAKKKARMAIGTKHKDQASGNDKKRVRVRKSAKVEPKKKKGRVRSEASITKLNAKK
jgi:nucleolar protein 12